MTDRSGGFDGGYGVTIQKAGVLSLCRRSKKKASVVGAPALIMLSAIFCSFGARSVYAQNPNIPTECDWDRANEHFFGGNFAVQQIALIGKLGDKAKCEVRLSASRDIVETSSRVLGIVAMLESDEKYECYSKFANRTAELSGLTFFLRYEVESGYFSSTFNATFVSTDIFSWSAQENNSEVLNALNESKIKETFAFISRLKDETDEGVVVTVSKGCK